MRRMCGVLTPHCVAPIVSTDILGQRTSIRRRKVGVFAEDARMIGMSDVSADDEEEIIVTPLMLEMGGLVRLKRPRPEDFAREILSDGDMAALYRAMRAFEPDDPGDREADLYT